MSYKKIVFNTDFSGNQINIGDKVICVAPNYRQFTIGKVVTIAEFFCQIEYTNSWNYSEPHKEIFRQGYGQILKYIDEEAVKAETIKEFAEKAVTELTKNYSSNYCHWIDDTIDNIVKEMECKD